MTSLAVAGIVKWRDSGTRIVYKLQFSSEIRWMDSGCGRNRLQESILGSNDDHLKRTDSGKIILPETNIA